MAELHVVGASMAKRAEVAGVIADLERKAAQQRAGDVVEKIVGLMILYFRRSRAARGARPQSTSLAPRPATLRFHHGLQPRQRVCGRRARLPRP